MGVHRNWTYIWWRSIYSRAFYSSKAYKLTGAEEMARWIVVLGGMFGYPKPFRSDNARTFDNHVVQALMQLVGSAHSPSIPYRPQSNGQVERVNKGVLPGRDINERCSQAG